MAEQEKKRIISVWLDLLKGRAPNGSIIELPVLSGSMAPLIMPGSNVQIRSCCYNDIRMGDIIVFKEGNSLTIHRLLIRIPIGKKPLLYQKGDANRFGNWIRSDRVVGVVDAVQVESGSYVGISHQTANINSVKASFRQIGNTLRNMALQFPRHIKQWHRNK